MAESQGGVSARGRSGARVLAGTVALAAVYCAAGRLGLLIPVSQDHVTLLWAPTGIALAAVLRFGYAALPGIALGALLVNLTVGGPPGLALSIAAGNTLEALAGAWLLRRAGFRPSLERVRDVFLLIVLGVLAAPAVGATIGTASLAAFGQIPPDQRVLNVAGYWWLGDAMGALLVAPVLLAWGELPRGWEPRWRRVLEAVLLGAGLLVTSDLTLNTWVENPILPPPLAFTLFPFLVWAALRFGPRGAATATLLAVAVAVWATVQGLSPFAGGTLAERILYLHSYMAMAAVTSLLLGSVLTERRGAEAGLRESEERLRLALSAGRCGVWDWDIARQHLTWSDRVFEFHGVDPKNFSGKMEDFTSLIHPEDAERVQAAIQRALDSGEDYEVELRVVRPSDGKVRWLTTAGRALYDSQGRPLRMLGATLDVTDRHEAEEERSRLLAREREARAEAEAANEAKDRFLATLSHELRTPLAPVLAVVSGLGESGEVPPELRRPLDLIRRNVELEARLIDDLLDLTRIERGKLELHPEVSDAHKIAEHTIEICCEQEVQAGRLRVAEDLAAANHRIWADPSRLTQVMWNLLSNAVKFTPAGGTVTVRSRSEGNRLILQVSDTGVGIDPEVLPHVFDAFEQGRARPRGAGGLGLGLGLAISKAIVDMHGGELTAASEGRGRGATFTVSLPATLPQETGEIQTGEVPSLDDSGVRAPKSKIENLHILLVEDHADTAEAMADLLSLMGHRVTAAGTVAQALETARRERFDLVLSDLGLPDGSGLDVMREISRGDRIPGIALSGYGMEDDVRRSHEAGFSKHLTKPVSLQALEAAIRRTVRDKAAQG